MRDKSFKFYISSKQKKWKSFELFFVVVVVNAEVGKEKKETALGSAQELNL